MANVIEFKGRVLEIPPLEVNNGYEKQFFILEVAGSLEKPDVFKIRVGKNNLDVFMSVVRAGMFIHVDCFLNGRFGEWVKDGENRSGHFQDLMLKGLRATGDQLPRSTGVTPPPMQQAEQPRGVEPPLSQRANTDFRSPPPESHRDIPDEDWS